MVDVGGDGVGIVVGVVGGDAAVAIEDGVGVSTGASQMSSSSRPESESDLGVVVVHFGDVVTLLSWCSS